MRFIIVLLLLCGTADADSLVRRSISRSDQTYSRAAITVNGNQVAGSPKAKHDPKEGQANGFMSSTANTAVDTGDAEARSWAMHLSSVTGSLVNPSVKVISRYTVYLLANGRPNTKCFGDCAGSSNHEAVYEHPGGQLNGTIILKGDVHSKANFTGRAYTELADSYLSSTWDSRQKKWVVTGSVNGTLVSKTFPRTFSHAWSVTQQMQEGEVFKLRARISRTGFGWVREGLRETADNYGSGSRPLVVTDADIDIEVKVN